MSLTDHKINGYQHNIAELPDRPSEQGMTAAQLKAFFDGRGDNELKDSLNGIVDELTAATAAAGLGAYSPVTGREVSLQTALQELEQLTEAGLSIDLTPTQNSAHAVSSGGVYAALRELEAAGLSIDAAPAQNSAHAVSSGGVYTALAGKQDALPVPGSADNGKFLRVLNGAYALATVAQAQGVGF